MNGRTNKSGLWMGRGWVAVLSLAAMSFALPGCQSHSAEQADDRSPRQQVEDEFSGCPPLLPIDPAKGGWQLAPGATYRAIGAGDVIMIRAIGRMDVTYDITLAIGKSETPVGAPAAAASTKPTARKPPPSVSAAAAPMVYLYRRPPTSRLSGVQNDFTRCGHFRTAGPVSFVSVRDADGIHSMAVEPGDRTK